MCNYVYKKINGKEYIIVECKDDDYIYGNRLYGYYVLEKIGGKIMEEILEKKEKIYSILSKEKKWIIIRKRSLLNGRQKGKY